MKTQPGKVFRHGAAPYRIALLHGGPGACGELSELARDLAALTGRGILEPWQTADSVAGQLVELTAQLGEHAAAPLCLAGYSWGAWLALLFAAEHPQMVGRLLLLSAGPLEEKYAATLESRRMARLGESERVDYAASLKALGVTSTADERRAALECLHRLGAKCDCFDPLPEEAQLGASFEFRAGVFEKVWPEAAEMRRRGVLLEAVERIDCELFVLHGDCDPHPLEGVLEALESRSKSVNKIIFENCGHVPWRERAARELYLRRLSAVLSAPCRTL